MPFLFVGTSGLILAIALFFAVPNVEETRRCSSDDASNVLNMSGISKVIKFTIYVLSDDKYILKIYFL